MKYAESVLQSGEAVVYRGTISAAPYVCLAVFLSLLLYAWSKIALLMLLPCAGCFISLWWARKTMEIAVTNRRVILKVGFISCRSTEMNMDKIESVDIEQTIFGRMFNCGGVIIHGTGGRTERLKDIDSPLALRAHIIAK